MDKILVLMSTYNGEKYLREQIDSILRQVGCEVSLLVRDDGSTDGTHEILNEYKINGKLSWYFESRNLGAGFSFLSLLKNSPDFKYYAFADQDDIWDHYKLKVAIQQIGVSTLPTIYFSNALLVDSDSRSLETNVYKKVQSTKFETVVCGGNILGCTMVFNEQLANIIKSHGLPYSIVMHDYFLAVLCLAVGGEILYDHKCYMKYRQHSNNVVGVEADKLNALRAKLKFLKEGRKNKIDLQCLSIIEIYDEIIPIRKSFLSRVAHYRDKKINRITLACSHKVKYSSYNRSISFRLAILLGKC